MPSKTVEHHRTAVGTVIQNVRDRAFPAGGNLETLAKIAVLSPFHFHRIFKQLTGKTPGDHLRDVRLIRAAIGLRTTVRPILQIALAAGYQNHESFSRAFRRAFAVAPKIYRRNHLIQGKHAMKNLNPSIALIKIPVTNFQRACGWYRDTLGLEEEFAVDEYGWAQYKTGDITLCLYVVGMGGGDGKPGNETNFHLAVDDAANALALLKSRDPKMTAELVSSDDGGKFFMLTDPDGNTFKIVQRT